MFAALLKVRKKDFCIVLAGKHQIKSRDRAPLRRDRDRPKQALFGGTIWSRRGDYVETRGPFLESPENFSGPKSHS